MRLTTIRPRARDAAPSASPVEPPYRLAVLLDPAGRPLGESRDGEWPEESRFLSLGALAEVAASTLPEGVDRYDLAMLLALDPGLGAIRDALETADPAALLAASVRPSDVRIGPPLPRPGKVVCVGQNYLDHIREQHLERPRRPVLFAKFANAIVADGEPIRRPAGTHALDLEAEVAVIVGRTARGVPASAALDHVAGYSVANDVTARDWQGQKAALGPGERGDGQWLRAKGSDTFMPFGPAFVTADEVPDPGRLHVRSWLTAASGDAAGRAVQMQNGSSADMLWSVAELVSFVSAAITLDPGDVLLTGTPSGVGVFRDPPLFLQPGDVVRVEVEGLGSLTNPVADETGAVPAGSPAAAFLEARLGSVAGHPHEGSVTR